MFVLAIITIAPSIDAQPTRDHRNRPSRGPRDAPPPPKAETPGQKAGFVWVAGRWDWRNDKYEWIPGHWERERAGKAWREGRWEKRGDQWSWIEGSWGDASSTPPITPPVATGPREAPPAPREEKYGAKPGFVWVAGEWDWRNDKWEWVAGHWERERAGKRWRPSRWDARDGVYTRTPGDWIDDTPVANDDRPRQPPPPPREERFDPRPGMVWIAGEWDWRNGRWEWTAGRWERERPGKRWRHSQWEARDGVYTRTPGDWIDDGAPTTAPPRDRPGMRPPRRDWKIERAVVSSYWPTKGKVGSRVVIRGRNFPKDAVVLWNGTEVRGVKVTDGELRFVVPPNAATGMIAVRAGGRKRPLAVGNFEVAADFDAEAERRRLEDEARKRAEAEWAARQQKLAKDRAAREAAVKARHEARIANREERRRQRLAQIQAKYARAFLADPETQDELNLHAQRIAELERMADIAEIKNDTKLAIRIELLRTREDQRHDQRMAALDASFRAEGGGR